MTTYCMLISKGSMAAGTELPGCNEYGDPHFIVTDPRLLRPSEILDDPEIATVVLGRDALRPREGATPDGCELARLSPRGPVEPSLWQAPNEPADRRYAECPAGWTVKAVEPVDAMLGPQAVQIIPALRQAERILVGDQEGENAARYAAAVNAAYDAGPLYSLGTPLGDEAAAAAALDSHGADGSWWQGSHPCVYGPEFTALAARDLIGTVPGWTQDAYGRLTAPWLAAFGQPIHPGDTPARPAAGQPRNPAHQ